MPARHQIKSKPPREAPQPANGHREQFESIRAFHRADPSPEIKSYTDTGRQASRQAGRQAGRRGPSPEQTTTGLEPDDRYQNQTTTIRTTSQRTPRTIQSIDRLS